MHNPDNRSRLQQLRTENAETREQAAELLATARELVDSQKRLRRERYSARPAERGGELRADRQVGVEPAPLDSPDARATPGTAVAPGEE